MLSRFISKPSHHHLRLISLLVSSQPHHSNHPYLTNPSHQNPNFPNPNFNSLRHFVKHFSSSNKNNNGNNGHWNISLDNEDSASLGGAVDDYWKKENEIRNDFSKAGGTVRKAGLGNEDWMNEKEEDSDYDLFKGVEGGFKEVPKAGLVSEDRVNDKEDDKEFDLFKGVEGGLKEVRRSNVVNEDWVNKKEDEEEFDLFKGVEKSVKGLGGDGEEENWATADGYKMWDLDSEEKGENVFGIEGTEMGRGVEGQVGDEERKKSKEENMLLEKEEKELSVVLKGEILNDGLFVLFKHCMYKFWFLEFIKFR